MKLLLKILIELSVFLFVVVVSFLVSFGGTTLIFNNPMIKVLIASFLFIASFIFIASGRMRKRKHLKPDSFIEAVSFGALTGFGGSVVYLFRILSQYSPG